MKITSETLSKRAITDMKLRSVSGSNKYFLELLYSFTLRELKVRYRGSVLGILWIFFYPLSMTLISALILSFVVRIKLANIPYYLFAMIGFVAWNFFTQSISSGTRSLVANRELVANTNFPKETLVISAILSKLIDFFLNLLIFMIAIIVINKLPFSLSLLLPFSSVLISQILLQVGISLMTSTGNVFYRDIQNSLDIILQIMFYLTPILYPVEAAPVRIRIIFALNPVSQLIILYRKIFFSQRLYVEEVLHLFLVSLLVFISGYILFHLKEKKFADVI